MSDSDNPKDVVLRPLSGERSEMADLQNVLEQAAHYAELITGAPPGHADAQSTYSVLPEGKTYHDKFVFGIYLSSTMVGCADVIRGYPDPHTGLIGLLLIAEPFQRRGIGAVAYRQVEDVIRSWRTCTKVRIGVVGTNHLVLPFWLKQGFARTGETKPYRYGPIVSEVMILEKTLD